VDFAQAQWWVVQEDDIPDFPIPDDPALIGVQGYFQVGIFDPLHFPFDPIKSSNGLHVTVGVSTIQSYGPASGINLWSTTPPLLDTDFTVQFLIL
jgi:hypothetical protein